MPYLVLHAYISDEDDAQVDAYVDRKADAPAYRVSFDVGGVRNIGIERTLNKLDLAEIADYIKRGRSA